ncbi:SDR family oxidoreductase [Enterococcus faecalis]|uniref:SDR family oxidoreductase n=1 Tax=Enterococcus faecalis TaxID=1351 RepID=UPI000CF234B8|nr:SDR family oxidoreductase [Enterococcus faecalis]PQD63564.1 oxidoreductase [Enterococcus faecalis]
MKSLSEKVIVIMGASSGIGEATTRLLARKGAKLVIAARRQERLIAIKKELPEATILVQQADVTKEEEVQRVIKLTMEKYGRIDVLFNNAGVMPTAPLIEAPKGEWRQMLDINIMGVLNGIAAVLPIMVEQKSGQIIATDSVAGHVVYPDSAVYCGTKFAVRAIMEGLRQEQRENNIKSTIISPGAVQTELYQTISNRVVAETLHLEQLSWSLKAEDIAQAVVFAIDTPDRMSISEMVVRPTTQTI